MKQHNWTKYKVVGQVPESPYFTLIFLFEYIFLLIVKSTVTHCNIPFITHGKFHSESFGIKAHYVTGHL